MVLDALSLVQWDLASTLLACRNARSERQKNLAQRLPPASRPVNRFFLDGVVPEADNVLAKRKRLSLLVDLKVRIAVSFLLHVHKTNRDGIIQRHHKGERNLSAMHVVVWSILLGFLNDEHISLTLWVAVLAIGSRHTANSHSRTRSTAVSVGTTEIRVFSFGFGRVKNACHSIRRVATLGGCRLYQQAVSLQPVVLAHVAAMLELSAVTSRGKVEVNGVLTGRFPVKIMTFRRRRVVALEVPMNKSSKCVHLAHLSNNIKTE